MAGPFIGVGATSFPGLFPFELGRREKIFLATQFKREKPWERGWSWGGEGGGGYPKSPYHMPRKILLKKIVHI